MKKLLCVWMLVLALPLFAKKPEASRSATGQSSEQVEKRLKKAHEAAFSAYLPLVRDADAKVLFHSLAAGGENTAKDRQLVGELLLIANKETPKLVQGNQAESVTEDALEVIELWSTLYLKDENNNRNLMKQFLRGYPENGVPTFDIVDLLKGAKDACLKERNRRKKE